MHVQDHIADPAPLVDQLIAHRRGKKGRGSRARAEGDLLSFLARITRKRSFFGESRHEFERIARSILPRVIFDLTPLERCGRVDLTPAQARSQKHALWLVYFAFWGFDVPDDVACQFSELDEPVRRRRRETITRALDDYLVSLVMDS